MADRLARVPASIANGVPQSVNDIIGALHDIRTGAAAKAYLRHSIDLATRHLFLAMAALGILTLLVLLVVPRHFPLLSQEEK
jgi:MFS superfamily sulfate permease-like transporter